MDEIQRMWRVVTWKKVSFENERDGLSKLYKIGHVVWK